MGKSHPIVFDLHAGEMLYLPNGWFHHVENLGITMMANFWTRGKSALYRTIELNESAEQILNTNVDAAPLSVLYPKVKGLK